MNLITYDDKDYISIDDIDAYIDVYKRTYKDSLLNQIQSIKDEINAIELLYVIEERMKRLKDYCIENDLDFDTYKEIVNFENESDFNITYSSIVSLTFADIKHPSAGFGESLTATSRNGVTYGRELYKKTKGAK